VTATRPAHPAPGPTGARSVRPAEPADPVATHVAALERSLRGPAALRRSILREVRGGLDDAATAYRATGLDRGRAGELAVRDFGPVAQVAPPYQDELAAGQSRRTALLLAVAVPTLLLGWDLLWSSGAGWGGDAPPAVRVLARVQDLLSAAVAAVALALLVVGMRRTADPRRVARATGLTALAGALLIGGTAVAMNLANLDDAWVLLTGRPPVAVAYLVSLVVVAQIGISAVRSVRTARGGAGAAS
jgi:hypothetical protein